MTRFLIALALTPPLALAAPVPPDAKEASKNWLVARLAGTWELESHTVAGEAQDIVRKRVTFSKDGEYRWENNGNAGRLVAADNDAKPAEVDFERAGDKPVLQRAIYQLDGDTLKCCYAHPGAEKRPTDFRSTEENGWVLSVYKRVKK